MQAKRKAGIGVATLAGLLLSCAGPIHVRSVRIDQLETGYAVVPQPLGRSILTDPRALAPLTQPLGAGVSLLQVRDAEQWEILRRASPGLVDCPDLSRGIIVGLLSRTGQSLDGRWPIELKEVHVHDGAGLLDASFEDGGFLPNAVTYVDVAYIADVKQVLVVDIDGTRFYPQPTRPSRAGDQ
jgi:hypothetical protein